MSTKITFFGHAALCIETSGLHILVDPYLDENPLSLVKADTVQADFIIVTHGHDDHLGDTVAIARRTGALVITNPEISHWLQDQGIKAHAQHLGGGHRHPFGYLKFTLAFHSSTLPDGSNGGVPMGLLLTTHDNHKIYIAGDTALFGDMRLIGEEGVDLAILPIGDNYTMGPQDALRAVKLLNPRQVIPVHFNTWDIIAQDGAAWCQQVQKETGVQAQLLNPGQSFVI